MKYAMIILAMFLLSACSECDPGAFRCQGQTLEVCGGDDRWEPTMDCAEIVDFETGAEWECCDGDAGPGCYTADECGL